MEKQFWKKQDNRIWIKVASLALAAVLLLLCVWPSTKKLQYDVVLMGDSVIGNKVAHKSIAVHEYIAEQTDLTVFNGAFGGSGMAKQTGESMAVCNSSWCMVNLAQAICLDTWEGAKASMAYADYYKDTNRQAFSGYKERMEALSQIDFEEVEVLVIEHGTNDYNSGVPIDNEEDPFDRGCFGGALRSTLTLLQKHYPDLRIVLVTPAYCEVGTDEKYSSDTKDWGGGLLAQYVEKELEIAAWYGVEVIDAYHQSGINADNVYDYTTDGLHPNADGIILLGDLISNYLKGNVNEDK